jgi:transcriptional regulator GlxA family with amidase domain
MHIAILTFEGFNELDSLIALGILNRVKRDDWRVSIAAPAPWVTSMNGVVLQAHATLEEVQGADAIIVGSGVLTRELVQDAGLMARIRLDPERQLIGAQCSGTLMLARLGLLNDLPACTDLITKPWVQQAGVNVVNQPFIAQGNVATAGGCLSAQYLSGWVIARLAGMEEAKAALHYVAPVGEKDEYLARAMANIEPYLPATAVAMFA